MFKNYFKSYLILILCLFLSVFISCSEKIEKISEKVSKQQMFVLPQETNDLDISVEAIKKDNNILEIDGWAAVKNQDSNNSIIYCVLKSNHKTYIFDTFNFYKRPDVTAVYKIDRDNSGFNALIPKNKIEKGVYKIGILIKKDDKFHLQYFDKDVTV